VLRTSATGTFDLSDRPIPANLALKCGFSFDVRHGFSHGVTAVPRSRPSEAPAPPARRRRVPGAAAGAVAIRRAQRGDLEAVIAIDARVTGLPKREYWLSLYRRYGAGRDAGRQFLVAVAGDEVVGFVIGEVRDWEFGSPPCGWVFGINVDPQARQAGIGARLLEAICAGFRRAGVDTVRTMLARDNRLVLSFFRSQGMMAGPFIPLEMDLAP
jgi:ribosomal protein S18 acetylase RimI-like enzyme